MASHADIGDILGASLIHQRKLEAQQIHARDATSSSYTTRIYSGVLDSSDNAQNAMKSTIGDYLSDEEAKARESEFGTLRNLLEQTDAFFGVLDAELTLTPEDLSAKAFDYVYNDIDGAITIAQRNGYFGSLYRQMTTDSKTILQNVVSFGSLTALSTNVGSLTSTSPTAVSHCFTGVITFTVEDPSISAPKLKVSMDLTSPLPAAPGSNRGDSGRSSTTKLEADNLLTVDKVWQDGPLGISNFQITRGGLTSPTESGDSGAIFSTYVVTTPQDSDCDTGIFYFKVTRQAANDWLIEIYSDSAREDLVGATITNGTSGSVSLSIICAAGTTVAFAFSKTAAHSALAAIGNTQSHTININSPRKGDTWTIAVTNDQASYFATQLGKWGRFTLPASGSASAEYAEAKATPVSMT